MSEPLSVEDLAHLVDEIEASKLIVLTHTDDFDRIRAFVDQRPGLADGVHEVRISQFVEQGQIIVFPVGATRLRVSL